MATIRFVDLFSGIAGFRYGLQRASDRYECVWSNDWDKYANQVYAYNYGWDGHSTDDIAVVNTRSIPDFDLLCAGFPCQAFSVAGKRQGFEDTRGTMFYQVARIARDKRPRVLLLENVKGLLNHDGGKSFYVILQTLDELGYHVEWSVLNSKDYGVPQHRERVFIIGYLGDRPRGEVFPIREADGVAEACAEGEGEQLVNCIDANYYKGTDKHGQRTLVKVGNIAKSGHDSVWGRVYDPSGLAPTLNSEGGGIGAKTGLIPVLTPTRKHKRQNGRRFKEDGDPMFTLTGQDQHGIFDGFRIRRLTPLECERLQAFPDYWTKRGLTRDGVVTEMSDSQRYKMCGNAVTTSVVEYIGRRLLANQDA